jgi:Glycosyltransferase WbsX
MERNWMERRRFLTSSLLGTTALALPLGSSALGEYSQTTATQCEPLGQPLPCLTEADIRRVLNASGPLKTAQCFVVAYNFPGWHPTPVQEKWFGKGWTEFQLLSDARTLFGGHAMPRRPLWGYYNEADPAWAEREIDLASSHGIDAWMTDWYWHNGTQFYHEQLEQGFQKASNRSQLKFAVMWANHDWKNLYPARSPADAAVLLPQEHSYDDCLKVIDYCIRKYFHDDSYWRLDGKPVFAIFDLNLFTDKLTFDGARRALDAMRKRVRQAGFSGLHIQASHAYSGLIPRLPELGVQSATQYHSFAWTYGGRPPGGHSPYKDGALTAIHSWQETGSQMTVPFFPDCPVGWDDSPRYGASSHIVIGRSPDQYELLLRAARHYAAPLPVPIVFLSAWNEWTEDHVLLPDQTYGYSYLEAVRRVFRE